MPHFVLACIVTAALAGCASAPAAPAKAAGRNDPQCLRETGSRIPPRPGHCVAATGRSYDQEEIRQTGAATLGEAVRRLHPR